MRRNISAAIGSWVICSRSPTGGVVREDEPAERGAVEATVVIEDVGAEPLDDRGEGRRAGLDDGAGRLIGVDDPGAPFGQERRHGRLPGADPSREPHDQHDAGSYAAAIEPTGVMSAKVKKASRNRQGRPIAPLGGALEAGRNRKAPDTNDAIQRLRRPGFRPDSRTPSVGANLVEYILLVALIALAVIAAVVFLSGEVERQVRRDR